MVGDDIRFGAPPNKFREYFSGVAEKPDRFCFSCGCPAVDQTECVIEAIGFLIDISRAQPKIDAVFIAFDGETTGARHDGRKRLSAAHSAKAARKDPFSIEVAVIVLAPCFGESFISTLNNTLRSDVYPRTRSHLPIHHQPLLIEIIEVIPICPVRDDVRIRNQNPRRVFMRSKYANWFARLDDQCFLFAERFQRIQNLVEIRPGARGPANATIDNQLIGVFGNISIEIVLHHSERRLSRPSQTGELGSGWGLNVAFVFKVSVHNFSPP